MHNLTAVIHDYRMPKFRLSKSEPRKTSARKTDVVIITRISWRNPAKRSFTHWRLYVTMPLSANDGQITKTGTRPRLPGVN